MTTAKGATRAEFLAHARAKGATELSTPADIVVVDAVPLLGSGKVDYAASARLVMERLGEVAA
jgi:acyl-[acyl-carrier-protein]-phospholipid O-acyltransferase / long-chain-fatty-acid--[acyl-carrier-protein] ligase